MSLFSIVVVLVLTVLFIILSIVPLLPGQQNMDSPDRFPKAKKKTSRCTALRKIAH
jgi:hypothetical protein